MFISPLTCIRYKCTLSMHCYVTHFTVTMEKPHDVCSYANRIDDVIAGMLASLVVYGKFKLCLVQIGICCKSYKNRTLRRKSKDYMARN